MLDQETGLIKPQKSTLTYDRYLKIHELLSLQELKSAPPEHDELLFITIHQVYELWFKQILHEIDKCQDDIKIQLLPSALQSLKRINIIQKVLVHQVDVLETMPPNEFNRFRDKLNPASGFQSHQFRLLEYRLGMKDPSYLKYFQNDSKAYEQLELSFATPSVWESFIELIREHGPLAKQQTSKNTENSEADENDILMRSLTEIYRYPQDFHKLFSICEALMDIDEQLMIWRYRHVAMVSRMIGDLSGTGGSSGAKYLQSTLSKRAFPALWKIRNQLHQTSLS